MRRFVFLMISLLLLSCALTSQRPTPTLVPSTPTIPPEIEQTPGQLLFGWVTFKDGSPLVGVTICRSFASYTGNPIAVTDATGQYIAEFTYIPGDEMVRVYPVLKGYLFDPPDQYWRHYYGLEHEQINFTARKAPFGVNTPSECE